jgi:hypothetical protein
MREYLVSILYNTPIPYGVKSWELLDVFGILDVAASLRLDQYLDMITLPSLARCMIQMIYLISFERRDRNLFLTRRCIHIIKFVVV